FNMKVMRAGFASQGQINQAVDRADAALAQRCAQIDVILLAKTHVDPPLDRQPDAIACRAEIVAKRRDEAKRHRAVLDTEIARGSACSLVKRIKSALRAQRRDEAVERNIMIASVALDLAERHGFNKRQITACPPAIIEHGQKLVFVESGKRHHVDLDRKT